MNDKELLNKDNILSEIRTRAKKRKEEIDNNNSSTEKDKKFANDVIEFLSVEDSFNKVPKSTIFAMFEYLNFNIDKHKISFYEELYEKIIEEINKKYTLIEEEQIMR